MDSVGGKTDIRGHGKKSGETVDERLVGIRWVCFDRYELANGYIRPAPGATLEQYDPWEAYGQARRLGQPPPYQSLLTLLDDLRFRPTDGASSASDRAEGLGTYDALRLRSPKGGLLVAPTPEGEARLLAWCAEHGLLGVLLHQVQALMYDRQDDRGRHVRVRWSAGQISRRYDPQQEESAILRADPSTGWPFPCVVLRDLTTGEWHVEPIDRTWARFFPTVAAAERFNYDYPLAPSDAFWRIYAEPLDVFLRAALLLSTALYHFDDTPRVQPEDPDDPRGDRWHNEGRRLLERLAAPAQVRMEFLDDESRRQRWHAPSLLTAYGLMALQDVVAQRVPRRCPVDRVVFVPTRESQKYCRPECRTVGQKRAQRAKVRTKTKAGAKRNRTPKGRK